MMIMSMKSPADRQETVTYSTVFKSLMWGRVMKLFLITLRLLKIYFPELPAGTSLILMA